MGVDFDIDKLLEPYKEGGTSKSPVERSMSTIVNALVNRDGFPPMVVGSAILNVFNKMVVKGLEFKGDGSYGSKGAELFSCIKAQCRNMKEVETLNMVRAEISNLASCMRIDCPKRTMKMVPLSRKEKIITFFLKARGAWRL